MDQVKLFTIGFTQRSAKDFFTTIKQNDVRKIIDVRLNNTSQMAGFTKRSDLGYFLENLCGCKYVHRRGREIVAQARDDTQNATTEKYV